MLLGGIERTDLGRMVVRALLHHQVGMREMGLAICFEARLVGLLFLLQFLT